VTVEFDEDSLFVKQMIFWASFKYLGLPTKPQASSAETCSAMKRREWRRWMSFKAFPVSLEMAAFAIAGSGAKSRGTSPLRASPSK
jgi:hypothetical protein